MCARALRLVSATGVLVALACLAACSGAPDSADEAGASSADVSSARPAGGAHGLTEDSVGRKNGAGPRATGAPRTSVRITAVVKTGHVTLTSRKLAEVRAEIDDLLAAIGGTVDDEQTTSGEDGLADRSTLVLRVPVDRFETAKDALERLGTLKSSTQSANDVTTEVIDTAERVQTLQNSLDRLQRFQRSATDVRDLVRFEEQITRRQSELQSLKAQQTYLRDQTSMSTITVRLATPAALVDRPEDAGFLAGLEAGWQAFVGFVVVVLTVLGALLPFLVAGTLVGVPLWVALRALLRRRRSAAAAPTTTTPLPDTP